MIKTFYQEDIVNRLAAVITFGLDNLYSFNAIEERILASSFINDLENNEYNIESKIEEIVESVFNVKLDAEADISFKGLFIAESYFKLFLYFNKSFEYLFLYWPLSFFIEKYDIYHEMDFSNLKNDFELKVKETPLLKKLALKKNIKIVEISKLTGINEFTIDKYSRDDKYLYEASHSNIYKLATLFSVKENMFVSNLMVYLDSSIYLYDKTYKDFRNYLGLFFANYFDSRIKESNYVYDKDSNCFKAKDGTKIVVTTIDFGVSSNSKLSELIDSKTYLIIIPSAFFNEPTVFDFLKNSEALDIFILTQEYIYIVKKKYLKEITDTVFRSLVIRAKTKIN